MVNVAPSFAALLQKTNIGKSFLTAAKNIGQPVTYKTPITNIRTVVTPTTAIKKAGQIKAEQSIEAINRQVAAGGGTMTGGASPEYGQTLATLAAIPVASGAISGAILGEAGIGSGISLGLTGSESAGGGLGLSTGGSAAQIASMLGAVGKMVDYTELIGQGLNLATSLTKKAGIRTKGRHRHGASYWRNKYEAMYWKAKYEQARYGHGRMK